MSERGHGGTTTARSSWASSVASILVLLGLLASVDGVRHLDRRAPDTTGVGADAVPVTGPDVVTAGADLASSSAGPGSLDLLLTAPKFAPPTTAAPVPGETTTTTTPPDPYKTGPHTNIARRHPAASSAPG